MRVFNLEILSTKNINHKNLLNLIKMGGGKCIMGSNFFVKGFVKKN